MGRGVSTPTRYQSAGTAEETVAVTVDPARRTPPGRGAAAGSRSPVDSPACVFLADVHSIPGAGSPADKYGKCQT